MALWTPLLKTDNRLAAEQATSHLEDSRVEHFWDLWAFANRTYSDQLGLPLEEAWDLFILYEPSLKWNASLPRPTFWMQHRHLDTGTPYSKELLEKELLKLIR